MNKLETQVRLSTFVLFSFLQFSFSTRTLTPPISNNSSLPHTEPKFRPLGPLVRCSYLDPDFLKCAEPIDLKGNKTLKQHDGIGCLKVLDVNQV